MTIIDAIHDTNLFRPFLGKDLSSWENWLTALRTVYGYPHASGLSRDIIRQCTGRFPAGLPRDGFRSALFLCGRRSGKSRAAAIIGAYEAVLAGHERKLSRGERGVVAVCPPSRPQARVVKDYLRSIFETPLLAREVANETKEGFELTNGTRIEIMAGSFRTIRGYTLLAAIVDEAAFFGVDEESRVRSDTELIRAIKPGLATVDGRLVAITSPYARKGWTFATFQRHFGNNASRTLVWKCPSRTMNPTLPQSVVDDALAEDLQAARSEYLGEFRDDVSGYIPRELVEGLVVPGRTEASPRPSVRYSAFVDMSGGRTDDAALAIAHAEGRRVVVDLLRRYRAPFNPNTVVVQIVAEVVRYSIRRVTGDNYAAEFVSRAFAEQGVTYRKCPKPKSELYRELLPRLSSGEIELPDDAVLIGQLAGLERRTRSGGRDVIDHPPGGHDDVANVVAGVANRASLPALRAGPMKYGQGGVNNRNEADADLIRRRRSLMMRLVGRNRITN